MDVPARANAAPTRFREHARTLIPDAWKVIAGSFAFDKFGDPVISATRQVILQGAVFDHSFWVGKATCGRHLKQIEE